MNSFNKTEAVVFTMQVMLSEGFPFFLDDFLFGIKVAKRKAHFCLLRCIVGKN